MYDTYLFRRVFALKGSGFGQIFSTVHFPKYTTMSFLHLFKHYKLCVK